MHFGRVILVLFAMFGVLLSLSTVSAQSWKPTPTDQHACCRSGNHAPAPRQRHPDQDHKDNDCGGKCLAACCRVIGANVDVTVALSDEQPVPTPVMTWSIVAFSLTDPDSIFHPPRA